MKRLLLSFILLALMVFINIPREFYHSCDLDMEVQHDHGLSFSKAHEDCLVCDYTFSVFSSSSQAISNKSTAEYGEYQALAAALDDLDSFPYCEGRAPPVLA